MLKHLFYLTIYYISFFIEIVKRDYGQQYDLIRTASCLHPNFFGGNYGVMICEFCGKDVKTEDAFRLRDRKSAVVCPDCKKSMKALRYW